LPPLWGIPFSVKNSIDVKGHPTTMACESFAYTPAQNAPVVDRVLVAGGILIGCTNLDQFATGLVGHRSPYGTPRSVFDSDYTSGGSSSGSAVSVGGRLVSFSIGTDTAGSIRVPAAYNGLVGLKPTLGLISTTGLVPACKLADCVCVLATTVADAKVVFDVVKWYDEEDDYSREALPTPEVWPAKLRLGVPPEDLLEVLSPAYASLFSEAVSKLEELGCGTSPFDYSPFEAANRMLYGASLVAQRLVAFKAYISVHGLELLHPSIRSIFESSAGFSATQAYEDMFTLKRHTNRVARQFREHIDVLVVPSTVTHFTISEIDEDPIGRNKVLGSFTHFVNLTDLCAIAIPAGTWRNPKGNLMPFSITLIAPAGRDNDIMRLAEKFMQS
ncbi:allophanate hydrolase, partial [Phenoliferia sp. Uapishka_3]